MGVRIIHDKYSDQSVLYCSTTDWAFGPVFYDEGDHDSDERAQLFLEYLKQFGRDARDYSDIELEGKYTAWRMQEDAQWKTKEEVTEDE